jgi:hypothetical protein
MKLFEIVRVHLTLPLNILHVFCSYGLTQFSPKSFTCHCVISLLPNTYSIQPSSVLKLKPATWYISSATGKFFLRRLYFVFVGRACISSVEQIDFKRRSLQHTKIKFTFEEYHCGFCLPDNFTVIFIVVLWQGFMVLTEMCVEVNSLPPIADKFPVVIESVLHFFKI